MSKKFISLLIVLVVFSFISFSQTNEGNTFSLEQAKNYALENNLLIRNANLNVVLSEKKIWEAISHGLPQADFSIDYTDFFDYEIEFSFGMENATPPQLDYTLMDAGDLEILKLLSGFTEPAEPSTILMDNSASAKFQISQLIFNGQYWVGIKTAKIAKRLSEQSSVKTQEDVKELVTTAYYLVLITEESINILDKNLANLEKSIEQSEALLIAGMAEQYDIDQIKMSLSMLQNTKNSMMRNLELNYKLLRFQLGLEPNATLTLTESLEGLIKTANIENALIADFNYEMNINYQLVTSQEDISKQMLVMEKANYLPTIAGFYSYNEKIITTDFDMNPKNIAGVNLSWTLFTSNMRNVKRQQAEIDLDIIRNNKELLINRLQLEEKQYRYNLRNTLDNYELQKENLQLAENVYENIERKYNQGVISSLDLTQASNNYLETQNTYLTSIMEVMQSKLALDKLMSKL